MELIADEKKKSILNQLDLVLHTLYWYVCFYYAKSNSTEDYSTNKSMYSCYFGWLFLIQVRCKFSWFSFVFCFSCYFSLIYVAFLSCIRLKLCFLLIALACRISLHIFTYRWTCSISLVLLFFSDGAKIKNSE